MKASEVIAQFEMRVGGLLSKLGEKIVVENIRSDGGVYVADLTKTTRDFSKSKRIREQRGEIRLVTKTIFDVSYLKKYIDLLCRIPSLNENYLYRDRKEEKSS